MNKVAILQSNYIPWKGYFHIIQSVDHFVFLDTAQYTPRDWRNRNRIKTPDGLLWLTVPCNGSQSVAINKVNVDNTSCWTKDHLKTLISNYKRTRYFDYYHNFLENMYLNGKWKKLSQLNQSIIFEISRMIELDTKFHNSTDFNLVEGKNEKIISIVEQLGGDCYVSGPAGENYLKPDLFKKKKIKLEIMDYSKYPIYKQPWGDFCHQVSILDLLFCTGRDAPKYIWNI